MEIKLYIYIQSIWDLGLHILVSLVDF